MYWILPPCAAALPREYQLKTYINICCAKNAQLRYTSTMTIDVETVREYFAKLDLEPEVADIYIALHRYGPQTISELARNAQVERTRLYRLLDTLTSSGLVEVETQYKRSILHPAPISNLEIRLSQKEQQLRDLHTDLKKLEHMLAIQQMQSPSSRVQFYQGADGIKQMMWNQTKATTEILCLLYENMQTRTKMSFFERWVKRCNERDIHFKGIIGDNFIKTQQAWYGAHSNERLAHWESRYVDETVFPIAHSMIIYDNITAYYNWKDGEVFGIEIANKEIADSQRAFYGLLWGTAKPVDDLRGLSE